MKKLFIFILPLLVYSCIKDRGNYDYDYLPDVKVTNFDENSIVVVKQGEELQIIPIIETEIPTNELSFVWYIQRYQDRDTISFDRSLRTIANMNGGRLYFEIKHDDSEVRWLFNTNLDVVKPFESGWAILTKEGTRSHLNFMEQLTVIDFNYIPKLYYQQNNSYLPSESHEVIEAGMSRVWLVRSDYEVHLLNEETMKPSILMSEMFTEPIDDFTPTYAGFSLNQLVFQYRAMVANGLLYCIPYAPTISESITYLFDRPAEGDYQLTDKLASIASRQILAFDEKYKRYLWYIIKPGRIIATVPFVENGSLPVNPGNLGKDCIWMDHLKFASSTETMDVYSILKDDVGNYTIQLLGGKDYNLNLKREVDIPSSVMSADTKIAFNDINGNILFYQNNNIHLYNSANNTFTERWKTFDENILSITVYEDYLAVGTARGTNSRFTLFKGNAELVNQTITGQVVSMSYKKR